MDTLAVEPSALQPGDALIDFIGCCGGVATELRYALKEQGFQACTLEVGVKSPYAHQFLSEGDEAIVALVAACREAVGPEVELMAGVAYCWSDAREALKVAKQLEPSI